MGQLTHWTFSNLFELDLYWKLTSWAFHSHLNHVNRIFLQLFINFLVHCCNQKNSRFLVGIRIDFISFSRDDVLKSFLVKLGEFLMFHGLFLGVDSLENFYDFSRIKDDVYRLFIMCFGYIYFFISFLGKRNVDEGQRTCFRVWRELRCFLWVDKSGTPSLVGCVDLSICFYRIYFRLNLIIW